MSTERRVEFDTPGEPALRIVVGSPDIEIRSWAEPRTEIVLVARRSGGSAAQMLEDVRIELEGREQAREILIEQPKKLFALSERSGRFTIRIRCPHRSRLDCSNAASDLVVDGALREVAVKTASGDVRLDRVTGDLLVNGASGDLTVSEVGGHATVSSASGDVDLGEVGGGLGVKLVSGDLHVRKVSGAVAVTTVSGDVELATLGGGDVSVQTVSGDVQIGLGPGVHAWLDLSSVSGDTQSDLDLTGDGPAEGDVLEVRVKSVSGDVIISRAAVAT